MKPQLNPVPLTFNAIEEKAETFAREHGFDPQQCSVRVLAKKLGGSIEVLDTPDIKQLNSGSLRVLKEGVFTIFLSPTTSPLRDNFTIAHEIGHYVLHILPSELLKNGKIIEIGRHGDDRLEQQANRFAAALLMPRAHFIKVAKDYDCDVTVLAGRFRVSPQAAQVRLDSLERAGVL